MTFQKQKDRDNFSFIYKHVAVFKSLPVTKIFMIFELPFSSGLQYIMLKAVTYNALGHTQK